MLHVSPGILNSEHTFSHRKVADSPKIFVLVSYSRWGIAILSAMSSALYFIPEGAIAFERLVLWSHPGISWVSTALSKRCFVLPIAVYSCTATFWCWVAFSFKTSLTKKFESRRMNPSQACQRSQAVFSVEFEYDVRFNDQRLIIWDNFLRPWQDTGHCHIIRS
jgi:hypothetical protein